MKKNISLNAKEAFENFKEELAREMNLDLNTKNNISTKKIVEQAEKMFTDLGRS